MVVNDNQFVLSEVRPNIFLLDFKDSYDMAMHFMRYQEFYESPSPKFRRKTWRWIEFMKWYSYKYGGGAFTYATDWGGFNIPGDTIENVWNLGIPDLNEYDCKMLKVAKECKKQAKGDFYIIGARGKSALNHEIAHGFFYTNPSYKKEMTDLVKSLDTDFKKKLNTSLKNIGYTRNVFVDECQAYLATGVPESFEVEVNGKNKPFIKLFKKYQSI